MQVWVVIEAQINLGYGYTTVYSVKVFSKDPGVVPGTTVLSCGCCEKYTRVFITELVEVA